MLRRRRRLLRYFNENELYLHERILLLLDNVNNTRRLEWPSLQFLHLALQVSQLCTQPLNLVQQRRVLDAIFGTQLLGSIKQDRCWRRGGGG